MTYIPISSPRLSLLVDVKIHDEVRRLCYNITMHNISKQSYNRSGQKTRSEFCQAALTNSSTGTPFTCATTQAIVVTCRAADRINQPSLYPLELVAATMRSTLTSAGSFLPLTPVWPPGLSVLVFSTAMYGPSFGRYACEAAVVVMEHHGASVSSRSGEMVSGSHASAEGSCHSPVSNIIRSRGTARTTSRFSCVFNEHPLIPMYSPYSSYRHDIRSALNLQSHDREDRSRLTSSSISSRIPVKLCTTPVLPLKC
jgi:hypothetical protein